MALGGKTEEILASIPMDGGVGGEPPEEDMGEDLGLENAMADLSNALAKNQPREAAEAFRRAFETMLLEVG